MNAAVTIFSCLHVTKLYIPCILKNAKHCALKTQESETF